MLPHYSGVREAVSEVDRIAGGWNVRLPDPEQSAVSSLQPFGKPQRSACLRVRAHCLSALIDNVRGFGVAKGLHQPLIRRIRPHMLQGDASLPGKVAQKTSPEHFESQGARLAR